MGNIVASLCRSFWSPCSVWASGGWTLCRRCRTFSAVTGATPTLPPAGRSARGRPSGQRPNAASLSLLSYRPAGEQRDAHHRLLRQLHPSGGGAGLPSAGAERRRGLLGPPTAGADGARSRHADPSVPYGAGGGRGSCCWPRVMGAETPLIAEAPVLNTARAALPDAGVGRFPGAGVCLDTNVMSANGDTVADWLSLFPGRIGLVRLCDGNWHGWRAWGDGRSAGWSRYLLPADRGRLSGRFLPVSPR